MKTVRSLGRSTGSEIEKQKHFNVKYRWGKKTRSPIIEMAYCSFECVKKDERLYGDHTLFTGEVVLIEIEKDCLNRDKTLSTKKISPLLYLGIDNFITTDERKRTSLKDLPFHYKKKRQKYALHTKKRVL